jgi:outer membrane protein assembly factor BamE (lipoprotein component of BamABCDE complex)
MKIHYCALVALCLSLLFAACGTKPQKTNTETLDKGNAMKNEAIRNMDNALDKEFN